LWRAALSSGPTQPQIKETETMKSLSAGSPFPKTDVAQWGGTTLTLGTPRGDHDWQLVVVHRRLHCPICKTYLAKLQELETDFNELGVNVAAVSAETEAKARAFAEGKS
jgi:peroxiredoxin